MARHTDFDFDLTVNDGVFSHELNVKGTASIDEDGMAYDYDISEVRKATDPHDAPALDRSTAEKLRAWAHRQEFDPILEKIQEEWDESRRGIDPDEPASADSYRTVYGN